MTIKLSKPVGSKAFQKAWERHGSSRDDWGCNYVYDFGAWAIWKAAIRHERKRQQSGKDGGR